jgi:hypothetical protein
LLIIVADRPQGVTPGYLIDEVAIVAKGDADDVKICFVRTIRKLRKSQIVCVYVQQRAHVRTSLCVIGKQRGQPQVHSRCAKRRSQSTEDLFAWREHFRNLIVVSDAVEAVAHSHLELARTQHFHAQFVKRSPASPRVKSRIVRPIANQVVAFLILHYAANPAAEIVGIADGDASGLLGQIVEPFLNLEGRNPAIGQLLLDLIRIHFSGTVGRS